jgi:hypothetical protein
MGDTDFKPWESDHTALVHELWHIRDKGLTLAENFDAVASEIMQSRWIRAVRAEGPLDR